MKNTFPLTLRKTLFLAGALWVGGSLYADTRITLLPDQATDTIPAEIYGQFAEHLGSCIYGGIWVGEDSPIPNTQGYRNDVLAALQNLHIPVLRWPGGCFADDYYWRDGIGPRSQRPRMVNTHISLANTSPDKAEQVEIDLNGIPADKQRLSARILHADTPQAHNTFDHPDNLSLCDFRDMHIRNGKLLVTLPKLSIVTIAL